MVLEKSMQRLKHTERISRQTRQYRIHLNRTYDQKLREKLNNLSNQYEQICNRTKTCKKLEQQRLGIITQHEPQHHSLSTKIDGDNNGKQIITKLSIEQSPPRTSCHLFSNNCQLYPCQPIYHYTSFIKKEHDRTLQQRNFSNKKSDFPEKSDRQLPVIGNNRYIRMERTMSLLDEQSRLLHKRLTDKKTFGYDKERQYELRQDIQRHLKISAKFCA